jgi:hypothetical protein
VAKWRPAESPRIEPAEWYRNYHPEAWDEPDAQERSMMAGSKGYGPWPAELREIHARRRWEQARYDYRRSHPDLAEQEFAELQARYRERHVQEY